MSGLNERIKKVRKFLGLTQQEFGEKLGKSWKTINRWEAGEWEAPEIALKLIAQIFGVSYHWLKTGEGEMFEKPKEMRVEDIIYAHQQKMKENYFLVPLVGKAGAGFPQSKGDVEILGYVEVRKISGVKPEQLFAVEVHGDSMEPTLQEGDKVIAKIYVGDGLDIPNRKVVVVVNAEGELYVKRLLKKEGRIFLVSDNPAYQPLTPNDDARIVGIGLKLLREFKL